jgi:hypothetical protein
MISDFSRFLFPGQLKNIQNEAEKGKERSVLEWFEDEVSRGRMDWP